VVEPEGVTSPAAEKPLKTVFDCSQLWVTGLKPGVNERVASRLLRQDSSPLSTIAHFAVLNVYVNNPGDPLSEP
jgi:hypothetical protein